MPAIKMIELRKLTAKHGAPVMGVCKASALPENKDDIEKILPGAKTVIVLAAPHSITAISSKNIQVGQYDTIHTYEEVARASHAVVRYLESKGYRAVAVPAFIPIDMSPDKKGMIGAVDWRKAAFQAGIGSYGESGLLLIKKYGTAVRIGGLLTDAIIPSGKPLKKTICNGCMKCIKACPTHALLKNGKIDKKKCGDFIFSGGYRAWTNFLKDLLEADTEKRAAIIKSQLSMDLWQNFMTGNYYYCFKCQAVCPAR
jgi:epoxyqueuosine reductase QueG